MLRKPFKYQIAVRFALGTFIQLRIMENIRNLDVKTLELFNGTPENGGDPQVLEWANPLFCFKKTNQQKCKRNVKHMRQKCRIRITLDRARTVSCACWR